MDGDISGHRDLSPQDWKQSIISAGMIHPSFSSSGGRIELIWYFNYYKLRHCCSIKHCRNRATMKGGGTASLTSGWESHKSKSWTFYCYRIRTPQPPHLWHLTNPSAKLAKHKTHHLKLITPAIATSDKWPQLPLSVHLHPPWSEASCKAMGWDTGHVSPHSWFSPFQLLLGSVKLLSAPS